MDEKIIGLNDPMIPSNDVLKMYPDLELISKNQDLFDIIAKAILFGGIKKVDISKPENYFISLGHTVGLFSEIIATMEKNGWKKQ